MTYKKGENNSQSGERLEVIELVGVDGLDLVDVEVEL